MAIYVVMEPPGVGGIASAERALLVRDGFSWLAFLAPPLWLLWHRLWLEAAFAALAMGGLSAAGEVMGHGIVGSALGLLVSIYAGLEGQGLRIAALSRRGWRQWGVVEAPSRAEADIRYALEAEIDPAPAGSRGIVPDASRARPVETGLALGLSHSAGRP